MLQRSQSQTQTHTYTRKNVILKGNLMKIAIFVIEKQNIRV